MIRFGNADSSHSGFCSIEFNFVQKKRETALGDHELEEFITLHHLLLLQFLYVIWSMPTN